MSDSGSHNDLDFREALFALNPLLARSVLAALEACPQSHAHKPDSGGLSFFSSKPYADSRHLPHVSFRRPRKVLVAWELDEVLPRLREVEHYVAQGAFAAGFIAYEAAPAFDKAYRTHGLGSHCPYMVWAVFSPPKAEFLETSQLAQPLEPIAWQPLLNAQEYSSRFYRLKEWLRDGHTYQVNLTFPLEARFDQDPRALYAQMVALQPAETTCFFDLGRWQIACASPELFFELDGEQIRVRPMKGTMPRGFWPQADEQNRLMLLKSPKQQAENVMIVDLLRNDLGRVCDVGSVAVEQLFQAERYPTVWQMTSTIVGTTRATLREVFAALFPCGSVTGAPKVRTMEIIRELEPVERWVYCGAIGWVAPGRRARFAVPIRTAIIDQARGNARYHVGSGVVIDSEATEEYAECLAKGRLLSKPPLPEFDLVETLRFENGSLVRLREHLQRLKSSAEYFNFHWDEDEFWRACENFVATQSATSLPLRVRILLAREGVVRFEAQELTPLPLPLRVAVSPPLIDPFDVLLYHKTTIRTRYNEARRLFPDADDVILCNRDGYVTESTIANLVVKIGNDLLTPPLEYGLLPGVLREELLRAGRIREHPLLASKLREVDAIYLINSLRGWMEAVLI